MGQDGAGGNTVSGEVGPPARVRQWANVDARQFSDEISILNQPAVLSGLARDWPAVRAAGESPQALAAFLQEFDSGRPIEAFFGSPEIRGRFTYRADLRGFNFERKKTAVR